MAGVPGEVPTVLLGSAQRATVSTVLAWSRQLRGVGVRAGLRPEKRCLVRWERRHLGRERHPGVDVNGVDRFAASQGAISP